MSDPVIGYDAAFGLNEFGQPRLMSEIEVVKTVLMVVLLGNKGMIPSLPWIGMNIDDRLYNFYDDIDPESLKSEIVQQCAALGVYFQNESIQITKMRFRDQPSMYITIRGRESYPDGYMRDSVSNIHVYQIGITYDQLKKLLVDIAVN